MTNLWNIFTDFLASGPEFKILNETFELYTVILVAVITFLWILILRLIKRSIQKLVKYRGMSPDVFNGIMFMLRIIFVALYIWGILELFTIQSDYFPVVIGMLTTAVAFASMKTFNNFIAGIWIALSQPYHIGDYVRINDKEGIVLDISSIYTRILHRDRTTTLIPNIECQGSTILNFTLSIKEFEEKLRQLNYNLEKIKSKYSSKEKRKTKKTIQQIEGEIAEKEQIIAEINTYEDAISEENTILDDNWSNFAQRGKFVRYIFTFDLEKSPRENARKLDEVCNRWKKQFNFRPIWEFINIAAKFTYQITIITPDPMDIIKYQDDFMNDVYETLFSV